MLASAAERPAVDTTNTVQSIGRRGQGYFMVVNFQHGAKMSKMDGLRTLKLVFDNSVTRIERLNRLTGRVETLRTKARAGGRVLDVRLEGGIIDLCAHRTVLPAAAFLPTDRQVDYVMQ